MKIKKVDAYEILDSRGTPTVAARVILENDIEEFGLVPSGASTGSKEAIEKRDKGDSFDGKGVQGVIEDAEKGNYDLLNDIHELLKNPYSEQPQHEKWFTKRPDWARDKVGCSMLSCSS